MGLERVDPGSVAPDQLRWGGGGPHLDLYCCRGKNCCYKFYWPSFAMAYRNPWFSDLGKVWTNVALERSGMVLCSPHWGAHAGNEYWRTLLDKLTLTSIQLPSTCLWVARRPSGDQVGGAC